MTAARSLRRQPAASAAKWMLAADLGGTKIAVARVSPRGLVRDRRVIPTPRAGGDAVVAALRDALRALPQDGACAIAVGVPGLARRDGSVWAPNLPGWERMPLARRLRAAFRLPVLVESDRNTFIAGEVWRGAARGVQDAILVVVGTGIGAGILSGGRLLRGHGDLAGCIGWLVVPAAAGGLGRDAAAAMRRCGCLEYQAAGPGIAAAAERAFGRRMDARQLARLAQGGDSRARQVLGAAGEALGMALANLVSTLNPEVIVVAGGVAGAGRGLLTPAIRSMRRWAQPLAARQVRLRRSRLGARAGLLGAAYLAWQMVAPEVLFPQGDGNTN